MNTVEVRYVHPSEEGETRYQVKAREIEYMPSHHYQNLSESTSLPQYAYRPGVGERAVRAVFLHMHAKEAHVNTINLLKGEKCFGSVREGLGHIARVHKSGVEKKQEANVNI